MLRSFVLIICAGVFLLSGCPRYAALPQQIGPALEPVYTEKLPASTEYLMFSGNGDTFIAANDYSFVHLYDAATLDKRVDIKGKEPPGGSFSILGVGYIDDAAWYLATNVFDAMRDASHTVISIRQVDSSGEVRKYQGDEELQPCGGSFFASRQRIRQNPLWTASLDLAVKGKACALTRGRFSQKPIFVNKNHIASQETLLNWHDGRSYHVDMAHVARFGYRLTANSLVVTSAYPRSAFLFHDPVKDEHMVWRLSAPGHLFLSPDTRYAMIASGGQQCGLWRIEWPNKEHIAPCGRAGLSWGQRWNRHAFQPDSLAFAIAADREVRVYTTQPFKHVLSVETPKPVIALAIDAGRLAVADERGTVRVWDVAANKLLGEYDPGDSDAPRRYSLLALQPGGNKLVASQFDHQISHSERLMVFELPPRVAVTAVNDRAP